MIHPTQRRQFHTATSAWARWCVQQQRPYRHPSAQWSKVGWKYVHLRNSDGWPLARYERETGRILI